LTQHGGLIAVRLQGCSIAATASLASLIASLSLASLYFFATYGHFTKKVFPLFDQGRYFKFTWELVMSGFGTFVGGWIVFMVCGFSLMTIPWVKRIFTDHDGVDV